MRRFEIIDASHGSAQVPARSGTCPLSQQIPDVAPNPFGEIVLAQGTVKTDNAIRFSRRQFFECFRYPVVECLPGLLHAIRFGSQCLLGRNGLGGKKRQKPLGATPQGLFGGECKQPGPIRPEPARDPLIERRYPARIGNLATRTLVRRGRIVKPVTHHDLSSSQRRKNAFFHKLHPRGGKQQYFRLGTDRKIGTEKYGSDPIGKRGAPGLPKKHGRVSLFFQSFDQQAGLGAFPGAVDALDRYENHRPFSVPSERFKDTLIKTAAISASRSHSLSGKSELFVNWIVPCYNTANFFFAASFILSCPAPSCPRTHTSPKQYSCVGMSMFDFEFEDFDEPADEGRMNALLSAYEGNTPAWLDSDSLEDIANYYFEQGRYEDALSVIDRLLDIMSHSSDAWMRRGILLNNLERHKEALEAYDQALTLNPVDSETHVNRGITLNALGRSREALEAYGEAIRIDPINDEAFFNRGVALEHLNSLQDAITSFRQCAELNPEHPEVWYELGFCYDCLEKDAESIVCYERHIDIEPYSQDAWYNRGIVLSRMSRFEAAVDSYDMAIAIQGDFASAWYNRGNALANIGRPEEAVESYRKVIELEGGDAATWYNLGLAFEEMEDYLQAFRYFEQVIRQDESHPEAWYGMGCCLDALERHEEALALFDQALALKPDIGEFWHAKADCLYNAGNVAEALKTYKHIVTSHPKNRDAWLDLAETYFETGHPESALDAYQQALALHPDAGVYFLQARVLFALGRTDESMHSLKTAFRMDPNMKEELQRISPDMWRDVQIRHMLGLGNGPAPRV